MKTKLLPLLLFALTTNTFAADLPLDTPTEDFTINNDGTVLHKKTGLTWQRCAVGQTWNAKKSTCDGTTSTMNWDDAMASYSTGKTCDEWRLPRKDELDTIVEHGKYSPAINNTIFPNTNIDVLIFWSASVSVDNTDGAWSVAFGLLGQDGIGSKDNNGAVRIVRGGQFCSFDSSNTPTTDFTDNKDGTVTHKKTGLMWQRCSIGQTWNGTTCRGSASTMPWDKATKETSTLAGFSDWRLPTENELKTIVEYNDGDPAINLSVFPKTPSVLFWSASVSANGASNAWFVGFGEGGGYYHSRNDDYSVRLVRGEQSFSFVPLTTSIDLSAAISASTNRIGQNKNLTYTATATNNGTGTANNVALKFILPPRWTKTVSLPSDCKLDGALTVCNVGTLAAGADVSRSMTVSFSKFRGATSVGALVTTDSDDTNLSNNMGRVVTSVGK